MTTSSIPQVGDPATLCIGSDRYGCTIVKVTPSGKTVWIQKDRRRRLDIDGPLEQQSYHYTPDPSAPVRKFTLRKDGRFCETGSSCCVLLIGEKTTYIDPHF